MAWRRLLAAGCGLCWSSPASGLDSAALVQNLLTVHEQFGRDDVRRTGVHSLTDGEIIDDPDEYILDNSKLQHRGPGVLYRRSKNTADLVGKEDYAAWGSTVKGIGSDDGWVKVGEYYLPTEVKGATVLVLKGPRKPKKALKIAYEPTNIMTVDGQWVPADITGPGSKPGLYNVVVAPRMIASYPIDDVPETALQSVSTKRLIVEVKPTAPSFVAGDNVDAKAKAEAEAYEEANKMLVKVEDFVGNPMDIRFTRWSPMRVVMTMACDKLEMSREKCTKEAQFIHHGRALKEGELYDAAGVKEGDTIYMLRRRKQ